MLAMGVCECLLHASSMTDIGLYRVGIPRVAWQESGARMFPAT